MNKKEEEAKKPQELSFDDLKKVTGGVGFEATLTKKEKPVLGDKIGKPLV